MVKANICFYLILTNIFLTVKLSSLTVAIRTREWLNVCTAPHHTAPSKIQYRTDGKSRILPTNLVPDPSINIVGVFLCLERVEVR